MLNLCVHTLLGINTIKTIRATDVLIGGINTICDY